MDTNLYPKPFVPGNQLRGEEQRMRNFEFCGPMSELLSQQSQVPKQYNNVNSPLASSIELQTIFPLWGDGVFGITHPDAGELRSRKVVSRSQTRPTGKYPSWKLNRMLQWGTSHQLNAFRLLDATPVVVRFEEQPLVVHYMLAGIQYDHYPDLKVLVNGARELWSVKTWAEAAKPETACRTELMIKGLPKFGYHYRMVIAEDLATQPRLKNALMLLRFGRLDIPIVERERLRRLLMTVQELTWGAILKGALGARGKVFACRLILEGVLRIDMTAPLCEQTVITKVGNGNAWERVVS